MSHIHSAPLCYIGTYEDRHFINMHRVFITLGRHVDRGETFQLKSGSHFWRGFGGAGVGVVACLVGSCALLSLTSCMLCDPNPTSRWFLGSMRGCAEKIRRFSSMVPPRSLSPRVSKLLLSSRYGSLFDFKGIYTIHPPAHKRIALRHEWINM